MNTPMIRLEIDHMKQCMIHAFTDFQMNQDTMFKRVIDETLKPEVVEAVLREATERHMKDAIEEATKSFFHYGAGHEIVREMVAKRLTPLKKKK